MQWFDVNKAGLAKIIKERGFAFVINELIQNALDTDTDTVLVDINWSGGTATVEVVDEHPEGFTELAHAWTLFAESEKKDDPTKRGRFNLGEKLVLAVCSSAKITTTKGSVVFDANGRTKTRAKRDRGSRFWGEIPCLKRDYTEMVDAAFAIIPPGGKIIRVNGQEVRRPAQVAEIEVKSLDTVVADDDGQLKRTRRNTVIDVFAVGPNEVPYIHEMGIPICALEEGDPWHIDVQQKVPLTLDRSSLTPAFLRKVRLAVLNRLHDNLDEEQANAGWVRETSKEEDVAPEAMKKVLDLRFGTLRVIYDPTDPEANKLAVSKGYTLITGSQLSKEEWRNVKHHDLARPSGHVTPSNATLVSDPNGTDDTYPEEKVTESMVRVRNMMTVVGHRLLVGAGAPGLFRVRFAQRRRERARAWYGGREMTINISVTGKSWFNLVAGAQFAAQEECYALLIHELAHEFSGDHLSSKYHEALTRLGGILTWLALNDPELFAPTLSFCPATGGA